MIKILGLDLGKNSIGWALIEGNEVKGSGLQIFDSKSLKLNPKENKFESFKPKIRQNYQSISLVILTLFLFGMGIYTPHFWQFWVNLGIGGIIAILTTQRKN
jgi:predicted transporter